MADYAAAVIRDNPQNFWRLNEGAGATAALDYGNEPGMLWLGYYQDNGIARRGVSGMGFGGPAADGGSWNAGAAQLWNRVPPPAAVTTPYVPLPDPGTLEAWTFVEDKFSQVYVGWFAPNVPAGTTAQWGFTCADNVVTTFNLGFPTTAANLVAGQWNHVAMSWTNATGFLYVNGTQSQPITGTANIGGGRVHFFVGDTQTNPPGLNVGGLVSEIATYRRALSVGDLDAHLAAADLRNQRPHWIGQRQTSSSAPVTIDHAYSLGVTHIARSGSGAFSVPTGLRGFKIDIIPPFPGGRVSPGQPPYLWDVGWVSILDANGMLAEIRPNRDTRVWLPVGCELATVFTHDLEPGWVIDVTELDPA